MKKILALFAIFLLAICACGSDEDGTNQTNTVVYVGGEQTDPTVVNGYQPENVTSFELRTNSGVIIYCDVKEYSELDGYHADVTIENLNNKFIRVTAENLTHGITFIDKFGVYDSDRSDPVTRYIGWSGDQIEITVWKGPVNILLSINDDWGDPIIDYFDLP